MANYHVYRLRRKLRNCCASQFILNCLSSTGQSSTGNTSARTDMIPSNRAPKEAERAPPSTTAKVQLPAESGHAWGPKAAWTAHSGRWRVETRLGSGPWWWSALFSSSGRVNAPTDIGVVCCGSAGTLVKKPFEFLSLPLPAKLASHDPTSSCRRRITRRKGRLPFVRGSVSSFPSQWANWNFRC